MIYANNNFNKMFQDEQDELQDVALKSSASTTVFVCNDGGINEQQQQQQQQQQQLNCRPQRKIAFAKTHKTGSSTVQNILFRYGVSHDLTFAIPEDKWYFATNETLRAEQVLQGPWKDLAPFDLFAVHCTWDDDEIAAIVPDAKYLTIVREPTETFESYYSYYDLQTKTGWDIDEYARKLEADKDTLDKSDRKRMNRVKLNKQMTDLGLSKNDMHNDEAVAKRIGKLDKLFDLVMVMERFDESLVLLADAMCWPLEEVVYLAQNQRTEGLKVPMSNSTKHTLKKWLKADYQLYEHSLRRMDELVYAYGPERMALDAARVREMSRKVGRECVSKVLVPPDQVKKVLLDAVDTFETPRDRPWCFPITRRETDFYYMINAHQTSRVQQLKMKGVLPE